jgi:DMSO/TMAO reductase YedYZ molybdopterin-dependent catalytic subunit
MERIRRATTLLVAMVFFAAGPRLFAQSATGPSQITIGGAIAKPLVVSADDLKKMPRSTVRIAHDQQTDVYEGVALADLLAKAGVPHGEEIGGPWLSAYVLVEAADGFRGIFSLPEVDPGFLDSQVLVADTLNGAPLAARQGPFRLVVPHDKRAARWVRMLKSITIVQAPPA